MLFQLSEEEDVAVAQTGDAGVDRTSELEETKSEAMLVKPQFKEAFLKFKTAGRSCPEVTLHFASKCMNTLDLLTWKTSKTSAFFKFFEICYYC